MDEKPKGSPRQRIHIAEWQSMAVLAFVIVIVTVIAYLWISEPTVGVIYTGISGYL